MPDKDKPKKQASKSTSNNKVNYPYTKTKPESTSSKTIKSKPSNPPKGKSSKKKKKKAKKSLPFRIFKWLFWTCFFIGLTVFVVGLGYVLAIIKSTPALDVDAVKNLSEPTSFYDKDDKFMDNLKSEINRNKISFSEMPQNLKNAFISIEDQRFYEHNGVDIIRIGGSLVTDVKKIIHGESGYHGASTLTEQLLKNTVLTSESSALEKKIKEIWLAIELEKKMPKDDILECYMNTIPMGGTAYGVDAAANLYFGKSASELNLIECAYIAGITQAPTYYSGYNEANKKNPSIYINRTKTVLSKMKELKKITQAEYDQAIKDLDKGGLVFKSKSNSYALQYEWYINPTVDQVKKDLISKYKYTSEEVNKLLATGGLKIYTNMDRALQDYAQQVADNTTIDNDEELIPGSKTPAFQVACTIVDYHTGAVKVIIGGRGEHGAQSTNRAYSELRSIGSSTKPLTVYGPAINEKILTAASPIDDAPIPESIGKLYPQGDGSPYSPNNDDFSFWGNTTLRDGIKYSKNVVSVLVENQIGLSIGKSYGEKFGLKYNSNYTGIATLALGQFENNPQDPDGGTPYILASAFGVFGNGGQYTTPRLYSKVEDATGKVILSTSIETKQIFSPQSAYIMYDLLKGSRSYTGPYAQWGDMPTAGKTGTTTESKNLWFSGVTPYLSGSVWLGYYNSTKSMNSLGISSSFASKVWGEIMEKAHEGLDVKDIEEPTGLVKAEVCQDSGKLATDLCKNDPRGDRVYTEYFIKGTQPTTECDAHVTAKINSSNGKLATKNTPSGLITTGIFIKKANPNPATDDYSYVLPTEYDDTPEAPQTTTDNTKTTDNKTNSTDNKTNSTDNKTNTDNTNTNNNNNAKNNNTTTKNNK